MSPLINDINSDDSEMNGDLNNGDVNCGNGFINNHTIYQCNESSFFNDTNTVFENDDTSSVHCFNEKSHYILIK